MKTRLLPEAGSFKEDSGGPLQARRPEGPFPRAGLRPQPDPYGFRFSTASPIGEKLETKALKPRN